MDPRHLALVGAVATIALASAARAQTATQVVRFQVDPIKQVGVSGSPAPLTISTATAGEAPTSVSVGGTSYAITTNESNQKITASLDQSLPTGLTIEVALAAPEGAASTGSVALTTVGSDVVTGISAIAASALPITYRLSATTTAVVSAPATRVVTFTIVSGT